MSYSVDLTPAEQDALVEEFPSYNWRQEALISDHGMARIVERIKELDHHCRINANTKQFSMAKAYRAEMLRRVVGKWQEENPDSGIDL